MTAVAEIADYTAYNALINDLHLDRVSYSCTAPYQGKCLHEAAVTSMVRTHPHFDTTPPGWCGELWSRQTALSTW